LLDDYAIQKTKPQKESTILKKKAVFKMLSHHEIIHRQKKKETALKQTFEQKLDRINIRRVPDNSRILNNQKKENVDTKQTDNKTKIIGR
jgi:hypothetical protein